MSPRHPTPRQAAWRRSPRLRDIGRKVLTEWNAGPRKEAPVCGAKTKKYGTPCQSPALENGRCRVHGGLTPKGDAWHKPRWPARDSPRFEKKLNRKLADLDKRWKAREARKEAMTPEQRARHDDWHRRHVPGPAAARAAACAEIKSNLEARELFAKPNTRPMSPEAQKLATLVERLQRLQARQDAEAARIQSEIDELGIFA